MRCSPSPRQTLECRGKRSPTGQPCLRGISCNFWYARLAWAEHVPHVVSLPTRLQEARSGSVICCLVRGCVPVAPQTARMASPPGVDLAVFEPEHGDGVVGACRRVDVLCHAHVTSRPCRLSTDVRSQQTGGNKQRHRGLEWAREMVRAESGADHCADRAEKRSIHSDPAFETVTSCDKRMWSCLSGPTRATQTTPIDPLTRRAGARACAEHSSKKSRHWYCGRAVVQSWLITFSAARRSLFSLSRASACRASLSLDAIVPTAPATCSTASPTPLAALRTTVRAPKNSELKTAQCCLTRRLSNDHSDVQADRVLPPASDASVTLTLF